MRIIFPLRPRSWAAIAFVLRKSFSPSTIYCSCYIDPTIFTDLWEWWLLAPGKAHTAELRPSSWADSNCNLETNKGWTNSSQLIQTRSQWFWKRGSATSMWGSCQISSRGSSVEFICTSHYWVTLPYFRLCGNQFPTVLPNLLKARETSLVQIEHTKGLRRFIL